MIPLALELSDALIQLGLGGGCLAVLGYAIKAGVAVIDKRTEILCRESSQALEASAAALRSLERLETKLDP